MLIGSVVGFSLHKGLQIMYGSLRMEAKAGLKMLCLTASAVFIIVYGACGCADNTGNTHHHEEVEGSKLMVDAQKHLTVEVIVDTIMAEFMFDTGGAGKLILSEAFASSIGIDSSDTQGSLYGKGFSPSPPIAARKAIDGISVDILIGRDTVTYTEIIVDNTITPYDGILSIPHGDNRVWYLDFDRGYLILKDKAITEDTVRTFGLYYEECTGNCFVRNVELLFAVEETSFVYNNNYMLDTGYPGDLAILSKGAWGNDYEGLIEFLSKVSQSFTYRHPYEGMVVLNNMYIIPETRVANDIVRIMCQEESPSGLTLSIMGLAFLYRFNISIDLSGMRMLIHRRKGQNTSLSQASFASDTAVKMRTYDLIDGYYLISELNHSSDLYKDGLREMDVILAIDGITGTHSNAGHSYFRDKEPGDSVVFTILRNGNKMDILTVR